MNSRKEAVNNWHFSLALRSLAKGGPRRSLATRLGEAWAGGRSLGLGIMVRRILVLAVLASAAGAQAAGPWYVATNGADTGNDGLSWSQPFASISNAIAQASSNDIINVSNGVYTLAETVSNVSVKACKIRAASTNPVDTVLLGPGTNGWPTWRGVYMDGAGSTLEGFTVTNFCMASNNIYGAGVSCSAGIVSNCIITGNTQTNFTGGGAGLFVYGSGVADNCLIRGNTLIHHWTAGNGGGGAATASGGRIRNCRILDNWATAGAGGVFMGSSDDIIQDSVVASNYALNYGGGIWMRGGIVSNCQIYSNSRGSGGGIAVYPGSATPLCRVEQCVISNNFSDYGGGVWIINSTNTLISGCEIVNNRSGDTTIGGLYARADTYFQIRNCLVANNWGNASYTNYAIPGGAGMCVYGTNSLIENCTIVSNTNTRTADANWSKGAGLYATNGVRVVNSIIYYNVAKAGTDSNYYTMDCAFSNSCAAPLPALGSANIDVDPQFVARETGNYHLRNPSPCVNTGMNQDWMTNAVDLDVKQRIRYGTVDRGAYERIYDGTICNFW